ncbi:CHAT domain-containing protein [Fulvivirga sp. RKSG066]|uniref:CHAT domain-containing tetratricopeptide repeat protein n=1 Tax=Fulvivirga aurantia TaxID=2529383 RepID=UPI0012BCA7D2|nr:CHAT domain-containing tetratricopeptide repeat protein [Fulvivirga aurantia]MTI23165.1 CHAT domain-containing protein [Fulvivirga aurantia]
MRSLFAVFCFCLSGIAYGQLDGTLKLAISLGDGVQIAFDSVDRKHNFNTEVEAKLHNGDFRFSKGQYHPAVRYYHEVLEYYIPNDKKGFYLVDVARKSARIDDRFSTSEKLLRQIIKLKLSEEKWLIVTSALNNLGIYHHMIGDLRVAEKLYTNAMLIRGREFGKTSEYYVATLHNLAVLRKDQGRYLAAEDMLNYVTKYYQKVRGANSFQLAIVQNNQAMLFANLGRQQEATALLIELSKNIDQFPVHSLDGARILINAALVHAENGSYNLSTQLLQQARQVYENLKYTKHPDYDYLKMMQANMGLANASTSMTEEQFDDFLKSFKKDGKEGLAYWNALALKGEFLMDQGKYLEAETLLQQVASGRLATLGKLNKDYLKSQNLVAICQWKLGKHDVAYQTFRSVTKSYLKLIDKYFYGFSDIEKAKFWTHLKVELDAFYSFATEYYTLSPAVLNDVYNLRLKTKGLLMANSNALRHKIEEDGSAETKELFAYWTALRQSLSGYYEADDETLETLGVDILSIEKEVNEIEKELYRALDLKGVSSTTTWSNVSAMLEPQSAAVEIIRVSNTYSASEAAYIALVLKSGKIELVQLGSADAMETKMLRYYRNGVKNKVEESLSYDTYWAALQEALGQVDQLYLSLDGVYNLISINTLQKNNQHLINELQIEIVTNTATLADTRSETSNEQVVLFGNPDFGNPKVAPLPGTSVELQVVGGLFDAEDVLLITKDAATENSLKEIQKPRLLHIATHGFFDKDEASGDSNTRSLRRANPLVRSGLLTANSQKTDGVFTAYDAMNMNLYQTDLVVLSACETGLGDVVNGEGVYGLSRAFTIAGARHLIMSLWKVDDQATQELMTTFYRKYLQSGDITSAFREAQLALRQKYPDPYYWGAFVLTRS